MGEYLKDQEEKIMKNRLLLVLLMIFLFIGIVSSFADAATHATPPPPGSTSGGGSSGSSGGGSSGSSYAAPSFQPFVMTLLSSNGSPIGTITGKNEYSIILEAGNNTTIDGKNFTLSMYAEMGQKPSDDTRMNIDLLTPDISGLPVGMSGATALGVVNITRPSGTGWNLKLATLKLTFSVPGTPGADANSTYYLVRYDGTGYNTQKVSLKDSSAGILTFEMTPSSDTGLFTLVMAQTLSPTPTPTATPTPAPTSTPTPTPEPSILTPTGIGIMLAMFAVGAIVGGALIFIVFRK
jgi:hypothetical protein